MEKSAEMQKVRHGRVFLSCVTIGLLLLARDVMGLPVEKWAFLAVVAISLVCLRTEELRYFVVFLMPLFVGLPGNYVTILLIARFCLSAWHTRSRFCFSPSLIALGILFAAYVFVQNCLLDHITVYAMAFCAELALAVLLCADKSPVDAKRMAMVYTVSVMLLGICALAVYAREYALSEILQGNVRFGDDYGDGGMRMEIDPNFLGFFCLAGIASQMTLLHKARPNGVTIVVQVLLIGMLCFLGSIGLSRSFLICLFVLIFTDMLFCLKRRGSRLRCILGRLAFVGAWIVGMAIRMPSLFHTFVSRFLAEDALYGNGRLDLIMFWLCEYLASAKTILLGVGLFQTNVHVTMLQYLFGLGVCGTAVAGSFFVEWARSVGFCLRCELWAPIVSVALMSCTVPAARSFSALFPLVFIVLFSSAFGREGLSDINQRRENI